MDLLYAQTLLRAQLEPKGHQVRALEGKPAGGRKASKGNRRARGQKRGGATGRSKDERGHAVS